MFNQEQAIPCPICNTKIPYDPRQLLLGVQFVCPNCQSAIGLAQESKPLVETTFEKFEAIRGKVATEKK